MNRRSGTFIFRPSHLFPRVFLVPCSRYTVSSAGRPTNPTLSNCLYIFSRKLESSTGIDNQIPWTGLGLNRLASMISMRTAKKTKHKVESGSFQTPLPLAREVCSLLSQNGCKPLSVLEPTCGAGNFLQAALEQFPGLKIAVGVEIK